MYTDPVIRQTSDLTKRAYVSVYIDGLRFRFYNGNDLGISCHPNRSKNLKDRDKALQLLLFTLTKKLAAGWRPGGKREVDRVMALTVFGDMLTEIPKNGYSKVYQRDQTLVCKNFMKFILQTFKTDVPLTDIQSTHIEKFLLQFKGSATYYMNKRRTLSGIYSSYVALGLISTNPVQKTRRKKEVATLNKAYTKDQLRAVLELMKTRYSHLYLCSLIMYGCFLRPHREIRLLTVKDIQDDYSRIVLSGNSNKGKKVRVVAIPDFVKQELIELNLDGIPDGYNIFSGNEQPYNECYFSLQWSRLRPTLVKEVGITDDHTLYSIRATGAIDVYQKTKDPYKLQRLMGHSSLQVTLTYLRSLGIYYDDHVSDLPTL